MASPAPNAADALAEHRKQQPKPRKHVLDKTVEVRYLDVDVALYADDFEIEEVREIIAANGWTAADLAPPTTPATAWTVEALYYATRGDVWTRETHRQVQDLIAEMAGRAA